MDKPPHVIRVTDEDIERASAVATALMLVSPLYVHVACQIFRGQYSYSLSLFVETVYGLIPNVLLARNNSMLLPVWQLLEMFA